MCFTQNCESPQFSAPLCVIALLNMELIVINLFFVSQGRKAKDIINAARESVAKMIGGKPQDIIFTSGGTEV